MGWLDNRRARKARKKRVAAYTNPVDSNTYSTRDWLTDPVAAIINPSHPLHEVYMGDGTLPDDGSVRVIDGIDQDCETVYTSEGTPNEVCQDDSVDSTNSDSYAGSGGDYSGSSYDAGSSDSSSSYDGGSSFDSSSSGGDFG